MSRSKPFSRIAALFALILIAGCNDEEPITSPVKIVAFGDSLTAGYRLPQDQSFPAQLHARFLKDGSNGVEVENQGISGDTTRDGLARLNKVLEAKPDIVILELGANDMLRAESVDTARQNLVTIITELQKAGISVLLTGIRVNGVIAAGRPGIGEYGTLFTELGQKHSLVVYEDFLQGVAGNTKLNLEDGLHPNAEGVAVIVERIYPTLRDMAEDAAGKKAKQ